MISSRTREGTFAAEPVGSWSFIYGDRQYSAMHMFKYEKGWDDVDKTRKAIRSDKEFQDAYRDCISLMHDQRNEFIKDFAFWPRPEARKGDHIYDVRTYFLKAGSMYDWGNYWARGIKIRSQIRSDIPWGGFFSQLGHLNVVHHLW